MNIVFWLLVLIVMVLMWATCASMFKVIGKHAKRIIDDVRHNINDD